MIEQLENFIPFLIAIAAGYGFKRAGIFSARDGQAVSAVVLNITLPSAAFVAILRAELAGGVLLLIGVGFLVPMLLLAPAWWVGRRFRLDDRAMGVFLCNVCVSNLVFFLFPIFFEIYGYDGLARLAIYDIGNALSAFLVSYAIAKYYSARAHGREGGAFVNWRALILSPALIAVTAALIINAINWTPPAPAMRILEIGATANSLLVMLGLGIFLEPKLARPAVVFSGLGIKMGMGLALGVLIAMLLSLEGLNQTVVIMASGMPTGMTTLIYAVNEDLDVELATALVSVQIIAGFFAVVGLSALLPGA